MPRESPTRGFGNDMRSILERFGRQARLCLPDGWRSENFGAFLQPLRYKNKVYLGGIPVRVGCCPEDQYLYLGPPEHDLTQLPREAWIQCGSERYAVEQAGMAKSGDENSHVWAVVKAVEV